MGDYSQYMAGARNLPGCLVVLVDQSAPMAEECRGGGRTYASIAARAANVVLDQVTDQCTRGETVRDDFQVGVLGLANGIAVDILGYGSAPAGLLTASELETKAQVEEIELEEDDGTGKLKVVRQSKWIGPRCSGRMDLGRGLKLATGKLATWTAAYPNSFPPVVLVCTGGHVEDHTSAETAAELLKGIRTTNGAALLFICHLSSHQNAPMAFPADPAGLTGSASWLCTRLASKIPDYLARHGASRGWQVCPCSHGYVTQENISKLVQLFSAAANNSEWDNPFIHSASIFDHVCPLHGKQPQ